MRSAKLEKTLEGREGDLAANQAAAFGRARLQAAERRGRLALLIGSPPGPRTSSAPR